MLHNWKEDGFDPSSFFEDKDGKMFLTCTHILKCISCGLVIGKSQIPKERIACNDFPVMEGCTGKKIETPKEKWKAPIKQKERDVEKRDYPAKKKRR